MIDGLKIAKSGNDVSKASTNNMYIDTTTPLLKIFNIVRGAFVFNANFGSFQSFIIPHNLGYVPACLLFMERVQGGNRQLVTTQDTDFNDSFNIKTILVGGSPNNESFIVEVSNGGKGPGIGSGTYGWTFIVFYDELFND